jgi:protein Hikeshi
MGVAIHYQWPGKPFQLLGGLSNSKPSAIFALKGKTQISSLTDPSPTITLGISIEPLPAVDAQLQSLQSTSMIVARAAPPTTVIAQRIGRYLFNFLSGFVTENLPPGTMSLGQVRTERTYIPLKAFEDWWGKFNHKVESDPGFLERDVD